MIGCASCARPISDNAFKGLCFDCYQSRQIDDDLRDEVAKAAMTGIVGYQGLMEASPKDVAVWAFDLADAFMAERSRRREGR